MCCIAKGDLYDTAGKILSFEKNSIKDIWNSSEMIQARKKMLAGERIESCSQCYDEETLGDHSMRIGFNDKWGLQERQEILRRVEESRQNNYFLNSRPFYYDLRQGNLCNLKCRSCLPDNSVSIEKEYLRLADKDVWFRDTFGRRELDESYHSWFKNNSFYSELIQELPNVKKLYFTGGEPTLIEQNFELLQYCIENNYAKNIELMFNTNLTNITDRFINLITKFKYVMLNLSIEGFAQEQEYLRSNSKWPIIDLALNKLAQNDSQNMRLLITPVVQACNVLTIDKLFYYIENLNAQYGKNIFYFMPIILNDPAFLDISVLPQKSREDATKRLLLYQTKSKITTYDDFFKKRLVQLVSKLNISTEENKEHIDTFIKFTRLLDRERKQSFKETFPELFSSWSENSKYFKWPE